ncbi:MAG: SdpI family protein [Clostridiales bacterium]|nr:SdpI family protein [Clostridiales bacterium]
MRFWVFMLFCNLIVPLIMIIAGGLMWKHCPKEINGLIGYRTKRSMKNDDTWKFAHSFCGKLWWIMGLIIVVPSGVVMIPFFNGTYETIGIASLIVVIVQLIALVMSIIPTEMALKKTFDDDGTRR